MARWTARDIAHLAGRIHEQLPERRKYRNTPVVMDGLSFDSKLEARRHGELEMLVKAGVITDLKFHTHWDLHVNNITIGYYESDFDYLEGGQRVIEDCKGVKTSLYSWKKRHVLAEYGIEIREITA